MAAVCSAGTSVFPTRSLSYFCPETCGCAAGDEHCPTSCPQSASKQVVMTPDEVTTMWQEYVDTLALAREGGEWQHNDAYITVYGINATETNAKVLEGLLAMSYAYHNVSV